MTQTDVDAEFEDRLRTALRDWAAEAPVDDRALDAMEAPSRALPLHPAWLVAAAAVVVAVVASLLVLSRDSDDPLRVVDADHSATIDRIAVGGVGVQGPKVDGDRLLVLSSLDERVYEIDPTTDEVVDAHAIPAHVEGLTPMGDGEFLLGRFDPDEVLRVHLATGEVVARASFASQPAWVVADGDLWVVDETPEGGVLHRLDPVTLEELASFPLPHTGGFLAFDGRDLWLAQIGEPGVLRIDRRTGATTAVDGIDEQGGPTRAIAVDPSGDVWATVGDAVVRIDADEATVVDTVAVGRSPHSLVATADHVWTSNFEDGTVTRIDTGGQPLRATSFTAGLRPGGLAVGFGSLWISLHQEGSVLRVGDAAELPVTAVADVARNVEVSGRSVFVRCSGQAVPGRPTVVLEPDRRIGVASFGTLEAVLSQQGRVCALDRTDRVGGDATRQTVPNLAVLADDHRQALTAGGEEGPYVVVGYGDGALTAQLFADQFPVDVAGLVLLDPLPVNWFDDVLPLLDDADRAALEDAMRTDPEVRLLQDAMDRLRDASALGDLPLTVIALDRAAGDADDPARALRDERHQNLALSSARGELTIARGQTRVPLQDQSVIVEAIDRVLARASDVGN